jgi:hypothetical protein
MSKKYTLSEYGGAFTKKEALLDIYIFDTTEDDWSKVLNYLYSNHKYINVFFVDQQSSPFLMDVKSIFDLASDHSVRLRIDEEQLQLNCHFFVVEEIEFDIDPRAIDSDNRLTRLLEFIHDIGNLLRKSVVMTPESESHIHYLLFDPQTRIDTWSLPEWER